MRKCEKWWEGQVEDEHVEGVWQIGWDGEVVGGEGCQGHHVNQWQQYVPTNVI